MLHSDLFLFYFHRLLREGWFSKEEVKHEIPFILSLKRNEILEILIKHSDEQQCLSIVFSTSEEFPDFLEALLNLILRIKGPKYTTKILLEAAPQLPKTAFSPT